MAKQYIVINGETEAGRPSYVRVEAFSDLEDARKSIIKTIKSQINHAHSEKVQKELKEQLKKFVKYNMDYFNSSSAIEIREINLPEKYVYNLVHMSYPAESSLDFVIIGTFSSKEDAIAFASDEDVKDHYGGSLDEGDFEIHKMNIIPSGSNTEKLKKKLGIII